MGQRRPQLSPSPISSNKPPPAHPAEIINVDAEPLLLAGEMPARINDQLVTAGHPPIPDIPGNEPLFARLIFESLAARYATAIADLEQMLRRKLTRIHIIGGASRNRLLADLTAQRTGLPVDCGHPESSTVGNFAVQLAASERPGSPVTPRPAPALGQPARRLLTLPIIGSVILTQFFS